MEMSYEEWLEVYRPIKNHLIPDAAHDGRMFETYGAELEIVRNYPNLAKHVWTLEDIDGDLIICSGYHFVNRIGYFICETPLQCDYCEVMFVEDEDKPYLTVMDASAAQKEPEERWKLDVGRECNMLIQMAKDLDESPSIEDAEKAAALRSIVVRVASFEKLEHKKS